MLTTQAHIRTETPGRYLRQLCRHANSVHQKVLQLHRGEERDRPQIQRVEWSDTNGTLTLSVGRCTLHAGTGVLTVRAEAADEANLRQIQDMVTRNLERFGRRDHLRVDWQRPNAPTVAADDAG